jgi:hypothetical protein
MATFDDGRKALEEAIKDPKNKEKLAAAKRHPRLKSVLTGVTQKDMTVLNRLASTHPSTRAKCTQT